jgi:hypothetical protein
MAENDGFHGRFIIAWPWNFPILVPMGGLEAVLVETLEGIMGDLLRPLWHKSIMENISMGLTFGAAYYQLFLRDSSRCFDFPAFRKVMEGALTTAHDGSRTSIVDAKVAAHAALGNILHKNNKN